MKIRIAEITADDQLQARAVMSAETIADYAEAMATGATFPPVTLFHDGAAYWLADGFHRLAAAERAGLETIAADVREGSARDARLYATGANTTHGLRRTNADKRRAVLTILEDPEWSEWSDREIARRCGVTHPFVAKLRRPAGGNGYHSDDDTALIEGRRRMVQIQAAGVEAQLDDLIRRLSTSAREIVSHLDAIRDQLEAETYRAWRDGELRISDALEDELRAAVASGDDGEIADAMLAFNSRRGGILSGAS